MSVIETKTRTTVKAITWRLIAVVNSWAILSASIGQTNFQNAILMNITGFFAFYFFERLWSKISYGRYINNE
jgi:uncharacterized membrane protein